MLHLLSVRAAAASIQNFLRLLCGSNITHTPHMKFDFVCTFPQTSCRGVLLPPYLMKTTLTKKCTNCVWDKPTLTRNIPKNQGDHKAISGSCQIYISTTKVTVAFIVFQHKADALGHLWQHYINTSNCLKVPIQMDSSHFPIHCQAYSQQTRIIMGLLLQQCHYYNHNRNH